MTILPDSACTVFNFQRASAGPLLPAPCFTAQPFGIHYAEPLSWSSAQSIPGTEPELRRPYSTAVQKGSISAFCCFVNPFDMTSNPLRPALRYTQLRPYIGPFPRAKRRFDSIRHALLTHGVKVEKPLLAKSGGDYHSSWPKSNSFFGVLPAVRFTLQKSAPARLAPGGDSTNFLCFHRSAGNVPQLLSNVKPETHPGQKPQKTAETKGKNIGVSSSCDATALHKRLPRAAST
jgi:hypothetical protein